MELNDTDSLILAKLTEGRCTPRYLSTELSKQQPYVSQRLKKLCDNGYVVRIDRGLYQHANLDYAKVDAHDAVQSRDEDELLNPAGQPAESANTKADKNDSASSDPKIVDIDLSGEDSRSEGPGLREKVFSESEIRARRARGDLPGDTTQGSPSKEKSQEQESHEEDE